MDGSNAKIIELLERIAGSQEAMQGDIAEMRGQIGEVNTQLAGVNQRLDQTNQRFDHALRFMGSYHSDHEQRLQALEAQVFTKKS